MDRSLFSKPFMYRLLESCLTFRFFYKHSIETKIYFMMKAVAISIFYFFLSPKIDNSEKQKKAKRKKGI